MPFEILRNDIVNMRVDAIVNTANPQPVVGAGTDRAIHAKAGPELLRAREAIGPIKAGDAAITPAFGLDARFVIHTVGPVWRGGLLGEVRRLRSCYDRCLQLAWEQGCGSIAFPLIAAGNYGFPREKALQTAVAAFSAFLMDHEMQIYLVVFDGESVCLSEKLFRKIRSYIDENYVQAQKAEEAAWGFRPNEPFLSRCLEQEEMPELMACREEMRDGQRSCPAPDYGRMPPAPKAPMASQKAVFPSVAAVDVALQPGLGLSELLERTDAGFSETLLKLIDRTGKKDSAIYKKANVSKQHFSKIRNNPAYQPTKATAVAFAIALELDLEQTRDLIGRAGYALTKSSKFDVIIMYFIASKNYNMFDINSALFEFDQTLLGA